jgi:hypothetical protein
MKVENNPRCIIQWGTTTMVIHWEKKAKYNLLHFGFFLVDLETEE